MAAVESHVSSAATRLDGGGGLSDETTTSGPSLCSGYPMQETMATTLQPLMLPDLPHEATMISDPSKLAATLPSPIILSPQGGPHLHPDHHLLTGDQTPSTVADQRPINAEEKQLCMLCTKRFDMDAERDLFLAHLVMDHNVVIADVKHVPYFPGYVEEWRKMFLTLPLEVCPKIKTNYVAKAGGLGIETVEEEGEVGQEEESPREETTSRSRRLKTVSGSSAADDDDKDEYFLATDKEVTRGGVNESGESKDGGGRGDVEDSEVTASSPPKQLPEAGDAPAIDVLKRSSARPALEVEDPAIAAAHPAMPQNTQVDGAKRR